MPKVLLVEDDPLMYDLYQLFLKRKGHGVILATNGQIGLEEAKKENPDIILLDMMMPKMDGLEVLHHLKKDPELAQIPVVVISNLADQEYVNKALAAGAKEYILKSDYQSEELDELIQRILNPK